MAVQVGQPSTVDSTRRMDWTIRNPLFRYDYGQSACLIVLYRCRVHTVYWCCTVYSTRHVQGTVLLCIQCMQCMHTVCTVLHVCTRTVPSCGRHRFARTRNRSRERICCLVRHDRACISRFLGIGDISKDGKAGDTNAVQAREGRRVPSFTEANISSRVKRSSSTTHQA